MSKLYFRRKLTKGSPEALGKVGEIVKTNPVGDLGDAAAILFDQVHGSFEAHGADKMAGRMIGKGFYLEEKLTLAHGEMLQ